MASVNLCFHLPKILFSSLHLKLLDIAQRWAHKDAKHKKLLNLLCIVYVIKKPCLFSKHIRQKKLSTLPECRTKHPGTKHPMPFFDIPDKTSRIDLPTPTKHPVQFLSPRTKHPMPFLPPRTKHPMPFLPPQTKHPTLCLKSMKVHKTSHLVNCHYY